MLFPTASSTRFRGPDIQHEARFALHRDESQGMESLNAAELPSRRSWLEETESDLAHRIERRIAALDSDWYVSDPLYQRLWGALARVRRELSQSGTASDPRLQRRG